MRVIIGGSRQFTNVDLVRQAVTDSGFNISIVICGEARGADTLGKLWAEENGIPVLSKAPDWNKYGKRAGFLRNNEMCEEAEAAIFIWDGISRGTAHCMREAKKKDIPIHILMVKVV